MMSSTAAEMAGGGVDDDEREERRGTEEDREALAGGGAGAAELSIVSGDTGKGLAFLRGQLDRVQEQSGYAVTIVPMPSSATDRFRQYRLWLAAGNSDISKVNFLNGQFADALRATTLRV